MTLRRRPRSGLSRLRPRSAAQAFVEFALAAPFMLVLILGAGQLGAVAYGMVSTDTAAREGARYGAEHPLTALSGFASGTGTYSCSYAVDNESIPTGNPICQAVYRAHGLLDATKFVITITTNVTMSSLYVAPDVVRAANSNPPPSPTPLPCGSDAEVDGSVALSDGTTPSTTITVTSSGQGTVPTAVVPVGSTSFRLCLAVNQNGGSKVQTLNAVMGSGCGGYAGQATVNVTQNDHPYAPKPDPVVLSPNACSTPLPSQTPNPTPTPGSTATPVPTDSPPPAFTCTNQAASSTGYFTVMVEYPVPIFVPIIGTMVGDPNNAGQRTVHASVTERVEPCAITGSQ
jgi:hypothetical protein